VAKQPEALNAIRTVVCRLAGGYEKSMRVGGGKAQRLPDAPVSPHISLDCLTSTDRNVDNSQSFSVIHFQ
jgi:hypothetical protein